MTQTKKQKDAALEKEREEAWVGDAVLALFVREWLLREKGQIDGDAFIRFTTNDFLRLTGNPTAVEAEIGRIYQDKGLAAGFAHIEQHLLPKFIQREKVLFKQQRR